MSWLAIVLAGSKSAQLRATLFRNAEFGQGVGELAPGALDAADPMKYLAEEWRTRGREVGRRPPQLLGAWMRCLVVWDA